MKATLSIGIGLFAAVAGIIGCGDGGAKPGQLATLEAFDDGLTLPAGGVIGVSAASLQVGQEGVVSELRFINTREADLEITAIEIVSEPPGAFRLAGDADGGSLPAMPIIIAPQESLEGQRSAYVYLFLTRPESGQTPQATVRVASNSVSSDGQLQPVIEYQVRLQNAAPTIQVTPRSVNFGTVQQGKSSLQSINILNPGADTLVIDSFTLSGHPNLELIVGTTQYKVTAESASSGIVLETPIEVEPGITVPVSVRYSATDASEARGQVVFFSNDPTAAAGTPVSLQANVGGPCIAVNPRKVDFGGKLDRHPRDDRGRGHVVRRPVSADLDITEIGSPPTARPCSRSRRRRCQRCHGRRFGALGPADAPVVLQPNQKATLTVEYFPEVVSPVDGNNQPVYDIGTLRIRSNSFQPELLTELTGFGVLKECPTAVIIVQQGEEVIPQTKLNLIGSQSSSATGEISKWQWEVDQPDGSGSQFFPSAEAADPTFEVNVAGTYTFRLTVTDSSGEPSCVPAETSVFVNPDEAIHIELLWHTPNDPNENDQDVGADLDLHFLHPLAVGGYDGDGDGIPDGWFDLPFDTFWSNEQPNWGSLDPTVDDNPGLDRDDTDGVGPENLNLNVPEAGSSYRVGVHYWDDHEFGTSLATVRVFIFANLVFEVTDVELFNHDMWDRHQDRLAAVGTCPSARQGLRRHYHLVPDRQPSAARPSAACASRRTTVIPTSSVSSEAVSCSLRGSSRATCEPGAAA